jgi:hypothetical protein
MELMKIHSISLLAITLLFNSVSKAQIVVDDHNMTMPTYKGNNVKTIKALKNTTLLVVIDSTTSAIGKEYAGAFQQYWKFTPYKFISPGEISSYANSDQYSFFVFAESDAFMGGGGSGHSSFAGPGGMTGTTWSTFSIESDKIPVAQSFNNKFIYGIFIGGKEYDTSKPFQKMDIADYEIMTMTVYGMGYNNMDLRTIQLVSLQCIPQIVRDMQSDLSDIIETNSAVPMKDKAIKVYLSYQSKEIKAKTSIYFYGDAQKLLKTKKLLIDSSLADKMSVQYLSQLSEIDATQIQLVNSKTINDAIEKKDENIFYVEERCSSYGDMTEMFRICNIYGKKMVDFLGAVSAITEGSAFNPKALKTFSAEIFNKNESPEKRKDIQLEYNH